MAFIDEVELKVTAGSGGNGCVSFRREKYVPFGGPNGGDGGSGGDIYLRATRNKQSLLDFKYRPHFEAERGEHGLGQDMFGRGGEDLIIEVPQGTAVYDAETGEMLEDLIEDNQTFRVAKGGKGGKGNLGFKTSTNRAPRTATPGEAGESRLLKLELRMLADVGIVGLPNAGKSSFLNAVSNAKPKVADYPFTTLEPHLGVIDHKGNRFIAADLPGLIEGAAEGVGLGHKFLKHASRNRCLLHFVSLELSPDEIEKQVAVIRNELGAFDRELLNREQTLVFTKADLLSNEDLAETKAALTEKGLVGFFISSHTRFGIDELLTSLVQRLVSQTRASA